MKSKHRTTFLLAGLLALVLALVQHSQAANAREAGKANPAARPNFLIIMADDCTHNDLPLYGGQNARTPQIDRLATQGLVFNRAYLASAMCQPCRAELYTGQYPLRNGCAWNHSASRPETRSLPHHLQPLGYRVGLAGKVHVGPPKAFPFEVVPGFDPNCVRNPTRPHDLGGIRAFMSRDRAQPFCLVVALVEPHLPWVMGDASKYPAKQIKLPPNLADTPRTREEYSRYLAEITYMDGQVGEILALLAELRLDQETVVLFTSEQGSQFPGCKWTNWDTGLHTALIARWPGRIPAGRRTEALVQYADVAPTLLTLAGGQTNAWELDGTSFHQVLIGQAETHRRFAYGMHNNVPEGPRYPIRTVTDGRFRYIRNLLPGELYLEKHLMGGGHLNNPYWATWLGAGHKQTRTYELLKRYMLRPPEQFYLTAEDPYELRDLAGDPAQGRTKAALSAELDRWMKSQGDPGADVDTDQALSASLEGRHLHGPHTLEK